MTVGALTIDVPPGFRVSGQMEIDAEPGAVVRGGLEVIAGDGSRVIGTLTLIAPAYPDAYPSPAVTVTEEPTSAAASAPGKVSARGGGAPLEMSIRYHVNDMAWELEAAFPADRKPNQIDVDLGGVSVPFVVINSDLAVTASRRVRRVRALHSLADRLTQPYCLESAAMLYQPASALLRDLVAGVTVDWRAADFHLSPDVHNYLTAFKTRNQIAREVLDLIAADMVLRPDGSIRVRDTAPDASAAATEVPGQILEYRESELAGVEITGVLVGALGANDATPVLDYEIIDATDPNGRPEYRVKLYSWPYDVRIATVRQAPLGPVFNLYGPFPRKERIQETLAFRQGRASTRPRIVIGTVIAWEGPSLGGVTFLESGQCVAASPGDGAAIVEIVRDYHEIIVRAGATPTVSVLPADWHPDWSRYDGVHIEIDVAMPGISPTGVALVRTGDEGRVADEPIIAPNERLLGYVGQRWLRVQNARQIDIRIAGWWPELAGETVDLGFARIIVDRIELTVRQGRTETQISGRRLT